MLVGIVHWWPAPVSVGGLIVGQVRSVVVVPMITAHYRDIIPLFPSKIRTKPSKDARFETSQLLCQSLY